MDSEKYQITKLEDMVYCKKGLRGKIPILAYGQIDGRYFFILNIGGDHPTAYVEVMLPGDKVGYDDLCNIHVHGGITFGPDDLHHVTSRCQEVGEEAKEALDREYIGWDYGHWGDFVPWAQENELETYYTKKWNVDEIMEDVVSVADQLEKAKQRR